MASFKLTPEQEAIVFFDLAMAERDLESGTVIGQVYSTEGNNIICRCHYIDNESSKKIKAIIANTFMLSGEGSRWTV